jgi:amino acid transporter
VSHPGDEQETQHPHAAESSLRQLTPLLVWAVVFCDIGTSVYYVPGILYGSMEHRYGVGNAVPLFVGAALIGFLLLASKYVEICWRKPDGGGVVGIATAAFSPLMGCVGGLLISVDYFLTSAISSVSGIHYLGSVFQVFDNHIVNFAVATLLFLAIVNTIGIRESAALSLVMAAFALAVDVAVIVAIAFKANSAHWHAILDSLSFAKHLDVQTFVIGFSGAWLAFSGLESISQLSPAMRFPIKETARKGMRYVVLTMIATAPLLTLFSVALLDAETKLLEKERLISEVGGAFGGQWVKIAVVLTGSSLLLFAANTAIIGCYHVFVALSESGFMPSAVSRRNRRFETPQVAILVATIIPVLVILFTRGDIETLGDLYAFGLLGAFVLSSAGLDVIRWRASDRGIKFVVGLFTTLLVLVAWSVNLYTKHYATLFGGTLLAVGLVMAVGTRRKWFADMFYGIPLVARLTPQRILESEAKLETSEKLELLSLNQATAISQLYPSGTLVALRSPNPGIVAEAISREKGRGGRTIYGLYVEERTGLFVRTANWKPKAEGIDALANAARVAEGEGATLIPIYTVSYNAVEGIVRAAESLGVTGILIGSTQRSAIYHLLRGHVVAGLTKRLPPGIRLLLYG